MVAVVFIDDGGGGRKCVSRRCEIGGSCKMLLACLAVGGWGVRGGGGARVSKPQEQIEMEGSSQSERTNKLLYLKG